MSRDGKTLVFSYYRGTQNLFISETVQADAGNLTNDDYHKFVRLSPSGKLIASVMEHPNFGEYLHVTDLRGNQTRVNDHASYHPSWSGETKLTYLRWNQATQQTEVIQVDVSNLQKLESWSLKSFQGKAEWLDVNPVDETKLVVVVITGERQQILLRDQTSDVEIAKGLDYAHLRWSPDGSSLAWSGPADAGKESAGIWVIKLGVEPAPRRIVTEGYGPVWRADNGAVYFGRVGPRSGLYEFDLATNKERAIRSWNQTPYFDVIGRRLVYCELGSSGKNRVYSLSVE
jgi:Tol biopolymer transport system component